MQNDPLSQLRDIHWPDPQGFWPLAFGYYLVFFLVILLGASLIYFILWGKKKRALKKSIKAELAHIEAQYLMDNDAALVQAKISALIRRMVFFRFKEKYARASDLYSMKPGIEAVLPGKKTAELLRLLSENRFQKHPQIDVQLLLNLAKEQIKRCRI